MSTSALLAGIAGLLDDAGAGVYDPARVWTNSDTAVAIVIGALPQDPPQVIALERYSVRDDPKLTDSTVGVQIRSRGDEDPDTIHDRDDAIFDALHGLHDVVVNGVPIVLLSRQSLLPMPADENHRRESSANFYAQTAWPSAHRED